MADFVELFERGDFVDLGLKIKDEFKKIDDDRAIKKHKKYDAKYDQIIKKLYEKWSPFDKSENFFGLEEWELNRLSFAVAVDSVARGLKTSQIRKILNMSNSIYRKLKNDKEDTFVAMDVAKLSYTLAYSLGRHKRELETLARVLNKAITKLPQKPSKNDYEKVHNFLQAVLAYHRLLGGSD
ncbi:type III-A CRISPR-associated protein Csm2 [Geoglobus acetivorans]|uniref:CRISPR system Cms protein Csm2 n=1 Tax=Geoglobus acetivorans TaxID=565033 RepID=A0ABZ3H093_GEOAI|nr:type III-A CRISPR-associated protein Csm2 [Geoglobus acetivorans]